MKRGLRNKQWDYSRDGIYMVTILVGKRRNSLSVVTNSEVELLPAGKIVQTEWLSLAKKYENIELGEYVIMPDHFHGIIYFSSSFDPNATAGNSFTVQRSNLPAVMRHFTSSSSYKIKLQGIIFKWHTSYHDNILSSHDDVERASRYIRLNPARASGTDDSLGSLDAL